MEDKASSMLALFKQEPARTNLILKVALGGPVVIVLWHWLGDFLLPGLAVAPITMLLILIYGGALAFLTGRLIHAADRWQVESARQARRLLTGNSRRHAEAQPVAPAAVPVAAAPPPVVLAHFHPVYFLLRLQEEVVRSRREGQALSVIALDVTLPSHAVTPALLEKVAFDVAYMASNQAKTISLPLQVDGTEYVFVLPHNDRQAAKAFISKLVQAMGDYWCHYGLAVYPEDATDAEALFDYARENCEESRLGSGSSNDKRPTATARRA